MATKRALIKLVRSFLEDPPIFADWLEDHCVADRQWLEPVQESLRSNVVVVETNWILTPYEMGYFPPWKTHNVQWRDIRKGHNSLILKVAHRTYKPIIRHSTEHLCMQSCSYDSTIRWIFWPPNRLVGLFNPLLFGLCCIQYGWVKHPIIDRVLLTFQENGENLWTP